jgi:hypothetical protein
MQRKNFPPVGESANAKPAFGFFTGRAKAQKRKNVSRGQRALGEKIFAAKARLQSKRRKRTDRFSSCPLMEPGMLLLLDVEIFRRMERAPDV